MLASIFLLLPILELSSAVQFKIKNLEGNDVWIGIQGNPGFDSLNGGGFVLQSQQETTVDAPENWQGRFWARTYCDASTNHCETGDCGNKLQCNGAGGTPPATLVEITLKGYQGLDNYDVSLVDGYNLEATIEPIDGQSDGSANSCKKVGCQVDINGQCPEELQQTNNDGVIACKSACLAFDTDEYCCRGSHGTADTCKSTDWPTNYPKIFKDNCPDAYSYAYDDQKGLFTCKAETYAITFGG